MNHSRLSGQAHFGSRADPIDLATTPLPPYAVFKPDVTRATSCAKESPIPGSAAKPPTPACDGSETRHNQTHTGHDRSHTMPAHDQCAAHVLRKVSFHKSRSMLTSNVTKALLD